MNKFKLMFEFNSCINIPENEGKYNMQLCIAEHTFQTSSEEDSRVIGYNYNRWNYRSEELEIELPYGEIADMDDIFLYLCPDKGGLGNMFGASPKNKKLAKPISYLKLRAADYADPNPELEWVELLPEPIEDEIDSPEQAGIVGFRLSIQKSDPTAPVLKDQPNWKKKKVRRPATKKVRCYLFQCKDLPAADDDGASDPLVVVYNTID